jgi:hypothetical protein
MGGGASSPEDTFPATHEDAIAAGFTEEQIKAHTIKLEGIVGQSMVDFEVSAGGWQDVGNGCVKEGGRGCGADDGGDNDGGNGGGGGGGVGMTR